MSSSPSVYQFEISKGIASEKRLPRTFVASVLIETERALYLYGHGTTDPRGRCLKCGRELTHPGSILLGIGPECLKNWSAREIAMDNITAEDQEYLQSIVRNIVVDNWFPKSCILHQDATDQTIDIPANHPKLKKPENGNGSKTVSLDSTGKFCIIKFPYDAKLVEEIRSLEGRRWDAVNKHWTAWASTKNFKTLSDLGFTLNEKCQAILNPAPVKEVHIDKDVLDIPGLYNFQLDGVKFLESKGGNGLIGDEMGLGKTIQALGWLKLHPEKRPVVIVVPSSLKINWQRETQKWIGAESHVEILGGTKPYQPTGKILIINYDILSYWVPKLIEIGVKVLVADECHYTKNQKAKRTKAVRELAKAVPHTIFLSGTPITNRPVEFFTVLNMLEPREFNSWFRFTQRYCAAKNNGFGWDVSGASNTQELHERLNGKLMLRRTKAEVLKDLPSKRRHVVPIPINNPKEYTFAENDLINWIKEKFDGQEGKDRASSATTTEALARFNYLKQLSAEGALEGDIQWIKDCLDSNGKLVIFAVHHKTIDKLAEELKGYNPVVVDGRTSMDNRQKAVDRFQTDSSCRLLIGNIKAAGVGLTLTAASNVVFVELGWTPGEMDQAEDRIHRIGQENECTAWYLVAAETIMEEIAELLDSKRKVLDAVLDGKETSEESMLSHLLKKRLEG